jgi:hypothetical protein
MAVTGVPDPLGIIRYAKFVVVDRPFGIEQALPNCQTVDEAVSVTGIPSNPPSGQKRIQNLYWNPSTQELVFIIED